MNELFINLNELHTYVFAPDRLPAAICALIAVSVFGVFLGPLGGHTNPFLWRIVDILFGAAGSRLDNTDRKASDLVARGMIVTITAMVFMFLIGVFLQNLSTQYPNFKIVDIVALSISMAAGTSWYSLFRLYRAVHGRAPVKGAFYAIAISTRNNLATADEFTITRVGIGMAARSLDKAVVAPILWYLIGGLPAVYLYVALVALAWRFGKDGFSKGFGEPALNLEKLMGFVPNVFSGVLVSLAGLLTPTAGMTRSFIGLLNLKSGSAGYFEGGAPVTAMAWALRVSLGGATQDLDGSAIQRGWAGPTGATAKLDAKHLHRGLYITIMAHLLFLVILLVGVLIHGYTI